MHLLKVWNFDFQALLSLCSDELTSAKSALDLCVNQMKNVLNSQQLPENASLEKIGRAYYAADAFVQVTFVAWDACRAIIALSFFFWKEKSCL